MKRTALLTIFLMILSGFVGSFVFPQTITERFTETETVDNTITYEHVLVNNEVLLSSHNGHESTLSIVDFKKDWTPLEFKWDMEVGNGRPYIAFITELVFNNFSSVRNQLITTEICGAFMIWIYTEHIKIIKIYTLVSTFGFVEYGVMLHDDSPYTLTTSYN